MEKDSACFCYRVRPFTTLGVYRRGYMTVNPPRKLCRGSRVCEVWFVQSGTVTIDRGDREDTYSAGAVFSFIRQGDLEMLPIRISPEGVVLGCSLGELLEELSHEGVLVWNPSTRELLTPYSVEDPEAREKLAAVFSRILAQARSTDPVRYLKNRMDFSKMMLLLAEYCRSTAMACLKMENSRERHYCDLACAYVQENLSRQIRAAEVAESIGISYSYLHKLFARNMGMPLVEYINRERIRLATQLLLDYGCSLSDAGEAVGIPDTKYLSRLFHRFTGMTVTEFKKQHK